MKRVGRMWNRIRGMGECDVRDGRVREREVRCLKKEARRRVREVRDRVGMGVG